MVYMLAFLTVHWRIILFYTYSLLIHSRSTVSLYNKHTWKTSLKKNFIVVFNLSHHLLTLIATFESSFFFKVYFVCHFKAGEAVWSLFFCSLLYLHFISIFTFNRCYFTTITSVTLCLSKSVEFFPSLFFHQEPQGIVKISLI